MTYEIPFDSAELEPFMCSRVLGIKTVGSIWSPTQTAPLLSHELTEKRRAAAAAKKRLDLRDPFAVVAKRPFHGIVLLVCTVSPYVIG